MQACIELGTKLVPNQEKILALLASWSFHQKTTAKRGTFSIEKVRSITKNAAKQTRQHAGKKYRKAEYVQCRVCFVNEQVP